MGLLKLTHKLYSKRFNKHCYSWPSSDGNGCPQPVTFIACDRVDNGHHEMETGSAPCTGTRVLGYLSVLFIRSRSERDLLSGPLLTWPGSSPDWLLEFLRATGDANELVTGCFVAGGEISPSREGCCFHGSLTGVSPIVPGERKNEG